MPNFVAFSLSLLLHLALFLAFVFTGEQAGEESFVQMESVEIGLIEERPSSAPAAARVEPQTSAPVAVKKEATTQDAERPSQSSNPSNTQVASAGSESSESFTTEQLSARDRYIASLRAEIDRIKQYPMMARRLGQSGEVKIRLTINPEGSILKKEIIQRSSLDVFNKATAQLLAGLVRLKPFPPGFRNSQWEVDIPLKYQIQ